MKIGIIIGSIREGRKGDQVGQWVFDTARDYEGAEFEIIDLKSFNLPLLTSPTAPSRANRQYDSAEVTNWSTAIDACDAFIFVTPEYNHGVPGAFKNAVDSIGPEWQNKKVAFVSYGAANGVRSTEQWRGIVATFNMWDIRATVELNLFTDFDAEGFAPQERRQGQLKALLEQLIG